MFFQKDAETMSRKQIEEIQLNRLKWLVDYCCKNIPFYHDRLEKAGVTAEKIKTLDDIQYIPTQPRTIYVIIILLVSLDSQ